MIESSIVGDQLDQLRPESIIHPILEKYQGQRVRIVVYSTGQFHDNDIHQLDALGQLDDYTKIVDLKSFGDIATRGSYVYRDGEGQYVQTLYGSREYDIPRTRKERNDFFKEIYAHWFFTYTRNVFFRPGDTIKVFRGTKVRAQAIQNQQFASGITHCFLDPVIMKYTQMRDTAKSNKTVETYQTVINKCNQFKEIYPKGVPEGDMHKIADAIPCKFEVLTPFGETLFLQATSQKKPRCTF